MAMAKDKFSEEKITSIVEQINKESKLYDYRTKDYPFEVICNKFGEEGDPDVSLFVPEYQRDFVWKPDRQSKFIESVLLGVPLTPFLVSEGADGFLEIIDGSQRIRTLIAFFKNELKLRGLKKLDEINSTRYCDLPSYLQNRIKNKDFRIIVVDNADEDTKQDIFERINTTSEKLTDSEIRKGSYSGPFYNLILDLKDDADFKAVCPVPDLREKRGEREELLLRFFAYSDSYLTVRHDVANFLNEYLESMNGKDFNKTEYVNRFKNMISFVKDHFLYGFRKEENDGSTPRVRFEALAVGVYLAQKDSPDLVPADMSWVNSEGLKKQTTSGSSNNPGRLQSRVEFVRDALLGTISEGELNG